MKYVKKGIKWLIILFVLFVLANVGAFVYAKITPKIQIKSANSYTLLDNTGAVFFQGSGSKEWINLDNISKYVIDATIITEDKHFYQHKGFDYLRILKAIIVNITSGSKSQGASTISQQYAKNLFLDFDKTWERKWNEMWLTFELEADYSKDEILEGYLNTINYGHGKYGIENASKYYFAKSAKDLTIAESAMLVQVPKSPSNYSPLVDFNTAKKRQENILKNMYNNKIISKEEYDNAVKEELIFKTEEEEEELTTIMYYQDAVLRELKTISSIPSSYLDTGGLKIYTNLDINAQSILEKSIKDSIPSESDIQTASVMMDPKTGKILAVSGGRDYSESQYNRAVQAKRQVGSTMKPFLYYAALENGFTTSTTFTSEETIFTFSNNDTYAPKNYNEKYGNKPISMAAAIAYSDNIYAVKTHMFLGEDTLVNMAKRVGITSQLEEVPSLPLGTGEINLIEMAGGYSAFANEGYKITPHFISKVEDIYGNVLYEADYVKEAVLNKSLTYIMNNLLTAPYDSSFIDYNYPTAISIAPRMTHKYALKSGTTNTDNLSIGYNPDVITAVWVGYDDNRILDTSEYKYTQNIWINAMEGYLKDKPDNWYEKPSNVVGVLVEPISGKPVTSTNQKGKIMYFVKGSEPSIDDPVFDEISGSD